MISALLITDGREWQLAVQVRVMAWPRFQRLLQGSILVKIIYPPDVTGPSQLPTSTRRRMPPDIFATLVDCWASILVQDFIRRHGKPIYTGAAPL